MLPAPDPSAASAEPVYFDALLRPHRSMGPVGLAVLLAVVALPSLAMGTYFLSRGAWPIFGFYGVDVLALYLALRHSTRTARARERLRLTRAALTVEKTSHTGRSRFWQFQPNWLRVAMDDPPEQGSQLVLASHGRSLVVGAFLTPAERLDLAQALRRALVRWREPALAADPPG